MLPLQVLLAIIYSTESCVKPVTAAKRVVPFELLLRRLERYKLNSLDRFLTRAYYARMRKMNALASGIVVKLDKMYRNNPEVTLLRGVLLMSDREWREAVGVLKYAIELAPYRFESYEMLVEAYLSITMIKEAIQAAKDCIEKIGETERSLTCHCSEESVELLKKTLELVPDYKLQVKLSNIYRCRFLDDEKCDEHELLAMK
ncbi:unnamed protein product [Notodromas monacha]|uniref:Uncharacterized protein n=1 Tax=Notodromas monacha TaxID=399045 RepID=A0A7R9C1Y9_9CRUS|nr:unnamed protein product [Notodromas monacha]CAG0924610.1 unnamed protein product [Notodromas monacha]